MLVEVWRIMNTLLACLGFGLTLWLLIRKKEPWPVGAWHLMGSLMALMVMVAVASLESLLQDAEPGIRLVVVTAACVWTVDGLLHEVFRHRTEEPD